MSRSPTTRLRTDADFLAGQIPARYAHFWLPDPARANRDGVAACASNALPADSAATWRPGFPNDHPVELEIGCGKGLFITRQASAHPELNFIGVEWAWKFALLTAQRIASSGVANVRLLSCDARSLLPLLEPSSLRAIHVYFPDPWWKRRHRKRRLLDATNIAQFERLLEPGGRLLLATDVAEYFAGMQHAVSRFSGFARLDPEVWPGPEALADPPTHFARKYLVQGRPLYHVGYERRPIDQCHS